MTPPPTLYVLELAQGQTAVLGRTLRAREHCGALRGQSVHERTLLWAVAGVLWGLKPGTTFLSGP